MRVVVPAALDHERADRVVAFVTGMPRSEAAALVEAGGVLIGGDVVASKSRKVRSGDVLELEIPERPGPPGADPTVSVDVVHADRDVLVIDKPAGLVVHPGAGNRTGTLVNALLARYPDLADHPWPDPERPGIVHRLDKGTSGLLMIGRTPAALRALGAQLEERRVERRYLALVWGGVGPASGVIDAPLGRSAGDPTRVAVRADGRHAVTRYEVLERWSEPQPATLVRCTLETGRTHQIRVHMAAIGHPVVGDDRYRSGGVGVAPGIAIRGRPWLHAAVLGFEHPTTGAQLRFESPVPADLADVIARLS